MEVSRRLFFCYAHCMALQNLKIVGGGQSGADRAALDFAIEHSMPHSGRCPKGRQAEAGPLRNRYLILNVAGQRESKEADAGAFVLDVLEKALDTA